LSAQFLQYGNAFWRSKVLLRELLFKTRSSKTNAGKNIAQAFGSALEEVNFTRLNCR
jgi:hypothetical protein